MIRRVYTLLVVAVVAMLGGTARASAQVVPPTLLDRAAAGSVRTLIQVRTEALDERDGAADPAAREARRQGMAAAQVRVERRLSRAAGARRYGALPWISATLTRAELQRLASDPDVVRVEPDLLMRPSLRESTALVHAPAVWAAGYTGAGWTVAVLDSGVESAHPLFSGRVTGHACFSSTFPTDTATSLCPSGATSSTAPNSAEPCGLLGCDHGTHVAGIAAGGNAVGAGVARGAAILAIQIYSRIQSPTICGSEPAPCILSYSSDQVRALDYVLQAAGPNNVNRIAAANLSLNFPGLYPGTCDDAPGLAALAQAVTALRSAGVATVISAGNSGSSAGLNAPACLSAAVSVGSTSDTTDQVSSFSNRSAQLSMLAPGSAITSSVPGGGFSTMNGTSMAAPHVAGAFAVLKQLSPTSTVADVLAAMRASAVMVSDSVRSYPRLALDSAALALANLVTAPPAPPVAPSLTIDGNFVTLRWIASNSEGPADEYLVYAGSRPGASDQGVFNVGHAYGISAVVAPGTYWVRVTARNTAGQSAPSTEVSFTIAAGAVLGTPSNLGATVAGSTVTLRWQAPAGTGSPPHVIEAGSAPGLANLAVFETAPGQLSAVVTNVPPGAYYVRLRARVNGVLGAPSNEILVTVP